jgi:hypothetical protein
MKILLSLKTGLFRVAGAWKGILIVWIVSVLMAWMVAYPLKGALSAAFGSSMITERLQAGIDIEVISEPGPAVATILSSLGAGLIIFILTGFLVNVFLSGGLFGRVSVFKRDFWSSCGKNFWSFLVIMLITGITLFLVLSFVITIPLLINSLGGATTESQTIRSVKTALLIFLLILPVFLLWADFARAWQVRSDRSRSLAALGFGLSRTFRTFLNSWIMMVLLLALQGLYWLGVFKLLSGLPGEIGGTAVFIIAQVLVIIRIILKVYRYACVTSLMEYTNPETLRDDEEKVINPYGIR